MEAFFFYFGKNIWHFGGLFKDGSPRALFYLGTNTKFNSRRLS